MKLPEISIKNSQFVLILVMMSLIIGVLSFMHMPRSEDPALTFPRYIVVAIYPGTSPEDMEELVVDPLENAINKVEDIEEIVTTVTEGLAIIRADASFGIDIDQVYDKVLREINNVRDELPKDLARLDTRIATPQDVTILQIAMTSQTASYTRMLNFAEQLRDRIEGQKGVRTVKLMAYPEEEVRVSLDFAKMAEMNISLKQVAGVLKQNNANIPGGDISSGHKSFSIQTSGSYKDIETIRRTVVNSDGEKLVYLKDIADVHYAYADERHIGRFNRQKSLFLVVTKDKESNIIELTNRLKKIMNTFQKSLPGNIELYTAFEQASAVADRVNDFFWNLFQGVVLVSAIIFLFLGWRPAIIIGSVIPISAMIAIGVLDFTGYAIQQISIASLVIALGLLVDNGIVVTENIQRFIKTGLTPRDAAIKGTGEVGLAVVASTITTLLSFFPLTLMESATGEFLRSMPLTVIYTLSASLLLALTFTPIMAAKFLKPADANKPAPVENILRFIRDRLYLPSLQVALRFPWRFVALSVIGFIGCVVLFPFVGTSFFPTADKPLLLIEVDTPYGSDIAYTDKAVRFVESVLDTTPFVKNYTANVGRGNPQIYYNRIPKEFKKNHGQILVNFKSWDPEKFYTTLRQFRQIFVSYAGAEITFSELRNGPPFAAPIEIKILGDNLDEMRIAAAQLEKIVKETPGTVNVVNQFSRQKTDLKVKINRDKAGLIGLTSEEIDLAVRTGITGLTVDNVTFANGKQYPLVVRMPFSEKPTIDDFHKIYLTLPGGGRIPLMQVADLQFDSGIAQFGRYNMHRSVSVTADVYDANQTKQITEAIIARLPEIEMPEGSEFYIAGEYETQQESFGDLGKLLIVALFSIFAVLVGQFRSIIQPLVIFSAIPLAFTGSIIALFVTGWTFSFFAFVGFTSLVGIVVNNSIILVDYTNQLIRSGKSLSEALLEACVTRFQPIVLTSLTTILGLLPLTLTNTSLWSPMGWTIIGGMLSSTFLTLVIVPILYQWVTNEENVRASVIK
jgi:multidrug efflux pump subunit AcrB